MSYSSFPKLPSSPGWVDYRPTAVYDSIQLQAGEVFSGPHFFFNVPVGQVDPRTERTRMVADTNMWRPQRFPPPCGLRLRRLELLFGGDAKEIESVISQVGGDLEFVLWERTIVRLPLIAIGSRGLVIPKGVEQGSGLAENGLIEFMVDVVGGLRSVDRGESCVDLASGYFAGDQLGPVVLRAPGFSEGGRQFFAAG